MANYPLPITAVILTKNEEVNLPACLESLRGFVSQIIVVDSISDDQTEVIARSNRADFYVNSFENQARQFQWALDNCSFQNEWVLRIDADERWTSSGFDSLHAIMEDQSIDGIYVRMKIFFMGKFLRWGGMYPNLFLRVFKRSKSAIEDRWMDEHILVNGKKHVSRIDVIESNQDRQRNLSLWTNKHNAYSSREAIDFCIQKFKLVDTENISNLFGNKVQRKRWFKEKIYFNFPLFIRPFFYFFFRFVFQLGFLDGIRGFVYCVLHAFWYRFLVDGKIYQIQQLSKTEGKSMRQVLFDEFGVEL